MANRYHVEIVAPWGQAPAVDDALEALARQGIFVHIERENATETGRRTTSTGTYNKHLHAVYRTAQKAGE